MALLATQVKELEKPLDRSKVKERTQSGRTLSYVEGWHAIAEANRIFGFDGWQRETIEMREVRAPELVQGPAKDGHGRILRQVKCPRGRDSQSSELVKKSRATASVSPSRRRSGPNR